MSATALGGLGLLPFVPEKIFETAQQEGSKLAPVSIHLRQENILRKACEEFLHDACLADALRSDQRHDVRTAAGDPCPEKEPERLMKRFLTGFAATLALGAIGLAGLVWRAMPTEVTVGGHRVRMLVSGKRLPGSPAVILETFGPAYLEIWNQIQPGIAPFAQVVSCDHAGYWGSEPGPKPRDARQIAQELRAALQAARVPPPYLLVGYSFGGPYVRVYADLYPGDVVGMVMVDPAQEEFSEWLNRHFPKMNVVTEEDVLRQDEWGSQNLSLAQAKAARIPDVPLTLISAAEPGGPLLNRLLPEWIEAHQRWLAQIPGARHVITTNSGHGIFFSEPELVVGSVRNVLSRTTTRNTPNPK